MRPIQGLPGSFGQLPGWFGQLPVAFGQLPEQSLGRFQEAELLYRDVMEAALEGGFARDSFIARLMLFNFYFLRGRLDEAAAVCTEAARTLPEAGGHQQMRAVWNDLRVLTETRRVDSDLIKAVRLYHVEHWNTPARQQPLRPG